MPGPNTVGSRDSGGILFASANAGEAEAEARQAMSWLRRLGIDEDVQVSAGAEGALHTRRLGLSAQAAARLAPGFDTLGLRNALGLRADEADDLPRETLLAMLAGPRAYRHETAEELASALRMRASIVEAASRTTLAFHTTQAARPPGHWDYHGESSGFTLKPGRCLVGALKAALLPDEQDACYAFSCCRATEYLALLGIAQEAMRVRPGLYADLCRQWERRALTADHFRATFLDEHGSLREPLPLRYYVPGDRVWFRNPDDHSSDATGFEGSWVFYLGGGLFANFWKRDRPFTLESKCLEVYHWRDATCRDASGELTVDEGEVEHRVRASAADPERVAEILARMLRLRDPPGVYAEGGCIDASREHPRAIVASRAGLHLPDA